MSNNARKTEHDENLEGPDLVIGKVVSVNVPRRELRIVPETSHPERFRQLRELRLKTRQGKTLRLVLEGVRVTKPAVIAKVATDDEDLIASTRGAKVVIPRSERFPPPEGEYYVDDLIGLVVKDTQGSVIGRLCEIWETPANDVYQVLDDDGREILLPAIEDVILEVNIEAGEIVADISNLT